MEHSEEVRERQSERKVIEINVLLTYRELKILLQSLGYSQIQGIYLPPDKLSDEEVIRTLHDMSVKKIINKKETHFVIEKKLGQMLQCMGSADQSFSLHEDRMDVPTSYCYQKGEHILVSELCEWRSNTMRLILFDREGFQQWKKERA